jgi:uncharacterized repeat protein (TIGR01451 family)
MMVTTARSKRSRFPANLFRLPFAGLAGLAARPRRALGALAASLALIAAAGSLAAQELPAVGELQVTRPAAQPAQRQVLVELVDPPGAVVWAAALADRSVSREQARQNAVAATHGQMSRIAAAQDSLAARLAGAPFNGREIYRIRRALNAIALFVDADRLAELRRLPGVKAVHLLVPEVPLNATSVPFINAPQLWANTLGLPANITGAGIKIGIIDTGIDYQHPMFGGSGLLADYQANDRVTIHAGLFPTAKVVGGTDFAGDAYTGANTPVPDPNPTDCFGHGSHVAGTAAGFGVNADGTTYTGPYGPSTPFSSLRIGPGAAPQALLYSLRIFGCQGSTNLTPQAIDWSIDPNGDDDFSDHLDVINMSLGSAYGGITDTSAMASENAALVGVIVVAAAGNSGDTIFIHGSPASSTRTISVAASADPGVPGAVVTVNSPAGIAGPYSAAPAAFGNGAPNPSGQTANVVLVNAGTGVANQGCSALTNAAAVAGNIALVDRGTCSFQTKAATAQAAGAIGVIVANNAPGDPTLLTMGPDATQPNITIPAVLISFNDGATIQAQLPGVNATLGAVSAADSIASFSSRGPRNATPPLRLKPDITAPGVSIPSDQTGMTCVTGGGCITPTATGFDPGGQVLTISGTSMATPHVAGSAALMRQLHPDWSVEEIKALLMNGAVHDVTFSSAGAGGRLGLGRVGAGRIDDAVSASATVTSFDDEGVGAVSLSFDREVVGALTQVKTVRLVNHGSTDQTFTLGVDTTDGAAGVSFSLPGGTSVTVPAGQSTTFDVQMSADASHMTHVLEPTLAPTQAAPAPLTSLGNLARHFLNEAGAYLTFSQPGPGVRMRLPLYAAARPTSAMAGPSLIATGGSPTGSTTIPLTGTGVCTGTLTAGPACTGSFPTDEVSLVSPFELQVMHPLDPSIPGYFNIQYAGVAYDAVHNLLLFGVSTWGPWATSSDVAFNITVNGNRVLFNQDPGNMALDLFGTTTATGQDTPITAIFNTATSGVSIGTFANRLAASAIDSRLFDNNVIILAATPASLGLTTPTTPFTWSIQSCPSFDPLCFGGPVDLVAGPFTWEYAAAGQGLNFNGASLLQDLGGAAIPVTFNTANLTAHGSLGALLLHHHNAAGTAAQVIPVQGSQSADLAITKSMAPANPTLGQNVTFTITVSNAGPNSAAGVVVSDPLPAGLNYVSDDGGGAYVSSTGQWNVGAVAVSASATLHVVATVATTDPILNVAQITSSSLLDPNPANNQSQVNVMAPRSADVALSMTVSSPTVVAGGTVTYTLTLKNSGDDPSYSVNVHEVLAGFPALVPTSSTASAGVFDAATGMWNLGSMANGATETLALSFTAPNIAGPLTNNGTAGASTSDPNNANNSASATTQVLSPAAVSGTKTVSGAFVEHGAVTYTIVLTNNGTSTQQDNPGDEFDDQLPAGLVLTGASATSGTAVADIATNSVSWNGSIAPDGGTVTITIHATIAGGTEGTTISNQGTIHFDADGNGTNESTGATTNGSGGGATTFQVDPIAQVPTLSSLGLVLLLLLLAGTGWLFLSRRAAGPTAPTAPVDR